jgi:hypothetical protein
MKKDIFIPLPAPFFPMKTKEKKEKKKTERLRLGFRSIAFRYSILFALAFFIIFFIYFMITLVSSVQRMEEDTQKLTGALTDLTLSRL